jgi:hypothetical protein
MPCLFTRRTFQRLSEIPLASWRRGKLKLKFFSFPHCLI